MCATWSRDYISAQWLGRNMSIPGERVSSSCDNSKLDYTLEFTDANEPRRCDTSVGKILDDDTSHEIVADETARRNAKNRHLEGSAIELGKCLLHCDCGWRWYNTGMKQNHIYIYMTEYVCVYMYIYHNRETPLCTITSREKSSNNFIV